MSESKKKIGLVSKGIRFTFHSIVYIVELEEDVDISGKYFPIFSPNDIDNKELILKPTLLSSNNMEVVYGLYNVTPQFYQQIINKRIRNYLELKTELKNIYETGVVVGYILY